LKTKHPEHKYKPLFSSNVSSHAICNPVLHKNFTKFNYKRLDASFVVLLPKCKGQKCHMPLENLLLAAVKMAKIMHGKQQ